MLWPHCNSKGAASGGINLATDLAEVTCKNCNPTLRYERLTSTPDLSRVANFSCYTMWKTQERTISYVDHLGRLVVNTYDKDGNFLRVGR